MKGIKKVLIIEIVILVIILLGDGMIVAKENANTPLLSPLPDGVLGVSFDSPSVVLNETKINKAGVWPVVTPEPTPTSVVMVSQPVIQMKKNSYSVAVFGDSMEDTMGSNLDYLNIVLKRKYPQVHISFYNYGIGSQNVLDGVNRLCKKFEYKDRSYPSLCELKPDVIIIGSFAYNPFFPYNRSEHWLTLASLVQEARKITGNVYILAEIAPVKNIFGVGPAGVNWKKDIAFTHAGHIEEQLENAVGLAKTMGVPLIDAYNSSKNGLTGEGRVEFVNPGDGIHPSWAGHNFMAKMMAESINLE